MRFSSAVDLEPESVARFAHSVGDTNPLHHDDEAARGSSFGQRIASGPQTSALMMAATARHFSRSGAMVGLEFAFRFRRAVPATQRVRIDWLVVDVIVSESPRGQIVDLRGRMQNADGQTAVGAKGKVLLR
ncbi:MAG: MaoC family dehydratase [bacterium]|nr:MaoC family dehydratase [bacterium]